jgi:hypothetical protein
MVELRSFRVKLHSSRVEQGGENKKGPETAAFQYVLRRKGMGYAARRLSGRNQGVRKPKMRPASLFIFEPAPKLARVLEQASEMEAKNAQPPDEKK